MYIPLSYITRVRILIGQWRNEVKPSGRHFGPPLGATQTESNYLFTCNVDLICSVFLRLKLSHNVWFYSHNTPRKFSIYIKPQNPIQKAQIERKDVPAAIHIPTCKWRRETFLIYKINAFVGKHILLINNYWQYCYYVHDINYLILLT